MSDKKIASVARVFRLTLAKADRTQCVRLYCEQSYGGGSWRLQIRGPEGIRASRLAIGKRFWIGHASLNRAQMIELRDAINTELELVAERE